MNLLDVSSTSSFLGFSHLKRRACHVHAPPTIPSPQSWLSKCPSWCHKFMGNICRSRPECISPPPHHLQPVFSRGSVVRVFNPNCGVKDFSLHSKGKITSVLCLWAQWCETIKHPEMPSMRQTNQERMLTFPGKSAATEPSQMEKTHFEWQHFKRGPIVYGALHTRRHILQTSAACLNIWRLTLKCIFMHILLFQVHICEHAPPPTILKKHI